MTVGVLRRLAGWFQGRFYSPVWLTLKPEMTLSEQAPRVTSGRTSGSRRSHHAR
jgi:hypothetical protein